MEKHLRKHFMSIGYLSVKMEDGFWMKSGRKMKWMWSGCKAAPCPFIDLAVYFMDGCRRISQRGYAEPFGIRWRYFLM